MSEACENGWFASEEHLPWSRHKARARK
jgi:hypothetical protein